MTDDIILKCREVQILLEDRIALRPIVQTDGDISV
jgi:hypothetical protein